MMTASALHIDFETRSELDLREVGLHRYARHASTDIWCMAWAIGDEEPKLWVPGEPMPREVGDHVMAGLPIKAHNAPFELEIWNEILVKRHGWPELLPQFVVCTMAQAYAMGLPGALEDGALALGLHMLKDTEGRAIMLKFARPWRTEPTIWMDQCPSFTVNGNKLTGAEGLQRLKAYCQQDVRVERELDKRLMPLSAYERRVWLLDYKINQRGVALDMPSVRAAVTMAEKIKADCEAQLVKVTDGAVQTIGAVAALKTWMATKGFTAPDGEEIDSLAKQAVVDLLNDETWGTPEVRRALVLRQEGGKASTAKFDVMLARAGEDDRLRQMYQYHGAGTGRWAGRAVQTHNLPRDMPKAEAVEKILALVRAGNHDAIDMIYGPPLTAISRCLRSFFVAPPGKKIVSGDWSNIEGRGQAWFAGEQWKLDAFRAADAKLGPGIYELAYSRMFNVPVESVKDPSEERQVGKVSELAFGYGGAVGSGKVMGKTYGVKASDAQWQTWCDLWRNSHPKIAGVLTQSKQNPERWYRKGGIWKAIEGAAIGAVQSPGEPFTCGHPGREATFKMVGSFLWLLLPSGRVICYPYSKILEGEFGPQLTYMTVPGQDKSAVIYDPKNANNWARVSTWGGSLFNNIVQGFCRDFLADCMLRLDEAGAAIVLHTHDDINIEVADERAEGARGAMEKMMLEVPAWAAGLPLKTKPSIMQRYGK